MHHAAEKLEHAENHLAHSRIGPLMGPTQRKKEVCFFLFPIYKKSLLCLNHRCFDPDVVYWLLFQKLVLKLHSILVILGFLPHWISDSLSTTYSSIYVWCMCVCNNEWLLFLAVSWRSLEQFSSTSFRETSRMALLCCFLHWWMLWTFIIGSWLKVCPT